MFGVVEGHRELISWMWRLGERMSLWNDGNGSHPTLNVQLQEPKDWVQPRHAYEALGQH